MREDNLQRDSERLELTPTARQSNFDDRSSFGDQCVKAREEGKNFLDALGSEKDREQYQRLHWRGSFSEYVGLVAQNPEITRNAYQRMWGMINHFGVSKNEQGQAHYKIFDDPFSGGADAIFGMDESLGKLVAVIKAGAEGLGAESAVILLHGPVGTAKSTIARLLKRGLEEYSRSEAGALYTVGFKLDPTHPEYKFAGADKVRWCPMNEEPLNLVPTEQRGLLAEKIKAQAPEKQKVEIKSELCPSCREEYRELLERNGGDWRKAMENVTVKRITLSETDRIGIGTFQPKDEKNQDSTELTGDLNYRKIAVYGSDSDPRAFNFDGEFQKGNRGMVEFIEVLKLDVAFLYDLLSATQEHKIKPKKFAQADIDEVILSHTNEPEYLKLVADKSMEAFRDRTIKIDIPYNLRIQDEERIYRKLFGKHAERIAPHTTEIAAMWVTLTRLEEPANARLSLVQKMKLYDGREVPGFTSNDVHNFRAEAKREGMHGISPRFMRNLIGELLARHEEVTPLLMLKKIDEALANNPLIDNDKDKRRYRELVGHIRSEYNEMVKAEVQLAAASDPHALKALCANYLDNVKAYIERQEGKTVDADGRPLPLANERMMRSIEERLQIPETRKDDLRREMVNHLRVLEERGKSFNYESDPRLKDALVKKLFEDEKDSIKLWSNSSLHDREVTEKVASIKQTLRSQFGYSDSYAGELLKHVSDIFARGDTK